MGDGGREVTGLGLDAVVASGFEACAGRTGLLILILVQPQREKHPGLPVDAICSYCWSAPVVASTSIFKLAFRATTFSDASWIEPPLSVAVSAVGSPASAADTSLDAAEAMGITLMLSAVEPLPFGAGDGARTAGAAAAVVTGGRFQRSAFMGDGCFCCLWREKKGESADRGWHCTRDRPSLCICTHLE